MTNAVRLCRLCRSARPVSEFVWHDLQGGRSGVSARCVGCRNRGRRPDPGLPKLRYRVTRHAAQRYLERVRPEFLELPRGRALSAVRTEMRVRMAYAPWSEEWPTWLVGRRRHGSRDVGHLLVDEDTVFVLSGEPSGEHVVVTVLTRGGESTPGS